jgi:hypothetical protein
LVIKDGRPIEFFLPHTCFFANSCLEAKEFDLAEDARVGGDDVNHNSALENMLEVPVITPILSRRENSKCFEAAWATFFSFTIT